LGPVRPNSYYFQALAKFPLRAGGLAAQATVLAFFAAEWKPESARRLRAEGGTALERFRAKWAPFA
jgi:hypothetical protein